MLLFYPKIRKLDSLIKRWECPKKRLTHKSLIKKLYDFLKYNGIICEWVKEKPQGGRRYADIQIDHVHALDVKNGLSSAELDRLRIQIKDYMDYKHGVSTDIPKLRYYYHKCLGGLLTFPKVFIVICYSKSINNTQRKKLEDLKKEYSGAMNSRCNPIPWLFIYEK